jgi:hypothetical protein
LKNDAIVNDNFSPRFAPGANTIENILSHKDKKYIISRCQ